MSYPYQSEPTARSSACAMALLAERECVDLHAALAGCSSPENILDALMPEEAHLCLAAEAKIGAFAYSHSLLEFASGDAPGGYWTVEDMLDNEDLSARGYLIIRETAVPSNDGLLTRTLLATPSQNFILVDRLIGIASKYANITVESMLWLTPLAAPQAIADSAQHTGEQIMRYTAACDEFAATTVALLSPS